MIVGFTGTQKGMTRAQGESFCKIFKKLNAIEFHHGDCIGADTHAHKIVDELFDAKIIIHPPTNKSKRAFSESNDIRKPLPYLDRNKNIVDSSYVIIATPAQHDEIIRSGTWSTIRYAKKLNKECYIIFPDGSVEKSPGK